MKNKRKLSVKWHIFSWLLVFMAILLAVLWTFQIMFLDSFYKMIKKQDIYDAIKTVEKQLGDDNLSELLDHIYGSGEIGIRVFSETTPEISMSASPSDCVVYSMSSNEVISYYARALEAPVYEYVTFEKVQLGIQSSDRRITPSLITERVSIESLVAAKVIRDAGGNTLILASSVVTPVSSTVDTLRVQLIYITVITFVIALFIAIIISRRVTKPITNMIGEAKKLASRGRFAVFRKGSYKEASELADSLNYAATELMKTDRLRRDLIANVSHDLRTPLTMITGYSEAMRDIPGEMSPENIQIIIDEAARLSALVTELLDMSRLDSGVVTLDKRVFSLTSMLASIAQRFITMTRNEVKLTFSSDGEVFVLGDELKLSQVVYNLLCNAINHTGDDNRVVLTQKTLGDRVSVSVTDTGAGIPKDEQSLIWDRYYKTRENSGGTGTGLGLTIAKGVLELHSAEYGVESEPGHGSRFYFVLKRSSPPAPPSEGKY